MMVGSEGAELFAACKGMESEMTDEELAQAIRAASHALTDLLEQASLRNMECRITVLDCCGMTSPKFESISVDVFRRL